MMGHRGCRLGLSHPEIYAMQAEAIFRAAAELIGGGDRCTAGGDDSPGRPCQRAEGAPSVVEETARRVIEETGQDIPYTVGTMIEVPRAALTADAIAEEARLLLLWHQRSDPDDLRLQPGRC